MPIAKIASVAIRGFFIWDVFSKTITESRARTAICAFIHCRIFLKSTVVVEFLYCDDASSRSVLRVGNECLLAKRLSPFMS